MIQVGVVGYGTIGKRVADAVAAQPDMSVVGVAKRSPNYEAATARARGYPLYVAGDAERAAAFRAAGLTVAGEVDDLAAAADVIVDATPSGVGAENAAIYERHGTPAVFQGGESPDVADVSFTARANYDAAVGASSARVVSCNSTALSRLLAPLDEAFGVEKARVTLVRRGGDPGQTGRGPINDVVPDPITVPSHHGPDVQTVLPDVDIDTLGVKVPATLMHTHSVNVTLETAPSAEEVRELLAGESRIALVPGWLDVDGAGKLKDLALDAGRPRGDLWENCLWADSIAVRGRDLYCFQAVHQESDVVPESIDAVRALAGTATAAESVATTDAALGMGLGLAVAPDADADTGQPVSGAVNGAVADD
jgi:glyceraldehyde-3-phosphate dehydrogenase (NAD(P))